jgi:TolB protein
MYGQVVALYAIDPDGSDLVQLNDGESAFPAWSPDGSRLAFTIGLPDGSWQIATMAADGSDVQVLTSGSGISEVPSWSPDGTWIAYDYSPTLPIDHPSFHTVLYRIDADGSNPRILGDPRAFDVEPRISPDGSWVLFERLTFPNDHQHAALMVRDIPSGTERAITAAGDAVEHANWSPDGKWIVYDVAGAMSDQVVDDQLERIAADGTGQPVVLLAGSATQAAFKPWYSPDGSRILFGCHGPQGDDAACLMNADGSAVRILVDQPGVDENHFSWGRAAP